MLLQNLSFPIKSQLHVARHLLVIPDRFKEMMSKTTLQKSVLYDGSKFYSEFITDSNELIPKIIEYGNLVKFNNVNFSQLELQFTFPESLFVQGIGESKFNDGKKVYSLVLILHRNKNKWEVTTCFPKACSL